MTMLLALESSCDETACAIVKDGKRNIIKHCIFTDQCTYTNMVESNLEVAK